MTIIGSTLSGNASTGTGGGAIYSGGTLTVINSTFIGNTATNIGGAIRSINSTLTITNSTFSGNSANNGGAIENYGGTVTISDSTFNGNSATTTGGGLHNTSGAVSLYNTIIANSPSGGDCVRSSGTINAQNSLIMGGLVGCVSGTNLNNLTGDPDLAALTGSPAYFPLNPTSIAINAGDNTLIPGGISTDESGNPRIVGGVVDMGAYESSYAPLVSITPSSASIPEGTNADFTLTRTGGTGGDLTVSLMITPANADMTTGDYTLSGGSINGQTGGVTVVIPAGSASVNVNFAALVDAVGAEPDNTLTLALVDTADYDLDTPNSATATIPANDFVVTSLNNSGEGILQQAILNANAFPSDDTITFTVSGSIDLSSALPDLANNGTLTINGGGTMQVWHSSVTPFRVFNVLSGANVTLNGLIISGGGVTGSGGGINNDGTLTISNSTISGNSASSFGGGINSTGTLTINNSTVSSNSADSSGGGIYNDGTLTITNSIISDNRADFSGGGVTSSGIGTLTIINSRISGNRAIGPSSTSGAGALFLLNSNTTVILNSTISGNTAPNQATRAGIWIRSGSTLTLQNTIVAGNGSADCQNDSGTVNAQNSLIGTGLTCVNGTKTNNLTGDPMLNPDFTLSATSSAIDVGDNSLITGYPTDLLGNPRIQQGTVDMGAYELPDTTPVKAMAFVQQPTDANVNSTITPAVTVQLLDVRGALVSTASDSVSLSISTNPGGGNLGGTTSVNAVSGVATFSDLSIDAAGDGYTLDASVIGLTNVTSDPFNITAVSIPILIDRTSSLLVLTDDVNAVAEGASIGDRFAFSLTQQPTNDVTVTFTSSDAAQLEIIDPTVRGRYAPVGSYTVTFSASGGHGAHTVPWNSPVVINLYGVPDAVAEGAQNYAIQFTLVSSDPTYNNLAVPDEPVTVYDAGVSNSPTSLTLPKGGSGSYSIVLDGPPGFMALTTALGGNQDEHVVVTINGTDYTFTRSNWNVPQTVPVTVPDNGTCTGAYDLPISETVTSDISLNPYMDSGYGGPSSPAPNVGAPDEVIHVTDPYCTTGAQVNRGAPPALNGSAPNTVSPGSNSAPAPSGSGALPPSVEAPGAP